MSLDWKNVQILEPALQTTGDDVIFSGHGEFIFDASGDTVVPLGMELWLLAPPGASIADASGQALENMQRVVQVGIKNPGSDVLVNSQPIRYAAGTVVPNYVLQAPRGIVIKPGGPHIIGVETDTKLADLWARAQAFPKTGTTRRCFWAACTAIDGASNPVVLVR